MSIYFSKLLPLLLYPLGLGCVLILAALLLRRPAWRRASLLAALLLLWLGGNRYVAVGLARLLERDQTSCLASQQAQVLVLLGGGTLPPDAPRTMVEISGAGDRVLHAARLFQMGQAEFILASGGKLDGSPQGRSSAEDMADLLMWLGVPQPAIWLEDDSRNTYENALYSARLLAEKGLHRILLVTSAAHMPRARRLFEAQGLEVIACPTDFTVTDSQWQQLWSRDLKVLLLDLLPTAENLAVTTRILKEYLGILVYSLRGWK